jgi:glycosyltransferase involved in cell wall biosynthesis
MDRILVKRVLMVAFHYPPLHGSSGIQRTLKFSQYLPEFGWQPLVLSANPRAYSALSDAQTRELPRDLVIERAFALDTAKHIALKGRYPAIAALPDRWVSWWLGAVPAGLKLIRKFRPQIIWSTYPIATAHMIAGTLQRLSDIPWIADFRDPMTDEGYPAKATQRRSYTRIEQNAVRRAAGVVCTTPGTVKMYTERFPDVPRSRFMLIGNGYDEENFSFAQTLKVTKNAKTTLLHSGVLYPSERDPRPLFAALSRLSRAGKVSSASLKVILRASGHDEYLRTLISEHGIGDLVELAPPVSYHSALAEMLSADALLVLQASNCNHQIPAKLYEYLRAQRPILALTDPEGDTAATVKDARAGIVVPLDSADAIEQELPRFLQLLSEGGAPIASLSTVRQHSRKARTAELAQLFDCTLTSSAHPGRI